jgi:hypothetical protein
MKFFVRIKGDPVRIGFSRTAIILGSCVSLLFSSASVTAGEPTVPSYVALYRTVLHDFTRETDDIVQTRVDYRGLRNEPRWKQLVAALGNVDPTTIETREQRLAFWINVYNILAIDLILRAYPVESIKDIGSLFTSVCNIEAGKVLGRSLTLGEIEHKTLRPMGEPRIHAAIICASISCPPLARTPFEAQLLDQQLDAALTRWLSNPKKGMRLDRQRKTLHLSRIFDWFESDFASTGGVLEVVRRHIPAGESNWIRDHQADLRIDYFDYDWGLNE